MLIAQRFLAKKLSQYNLLTFPNRWLLFGSDKQGATISLDRISDRISDLSNAAVDFVRYYSSKSVDYDMLQSEIFSPNIFKNTKVIFFYQNTSSLSQELRKIVLSKIPPQVFLVIISEDLKKTSELRQLFTNAIDMIALHCYIDSYYNPIEYVIQYLKKYNISYDNDVPRMIVEMVSDNKLILEQELEKIVLYFGNIDMALEKQKTITSSKLTREIVDSLVYDYNNVIARDVCRMIANKEISTLVNLFDKILNQDNIMFILRVIQKYFLDIAKIKEAMLVDPKKDIVDLMKNLKIFLFGEDMTIFRTAIYNMSVEKAKKIATEAINTEIIFKKYSSTSSMTIIGHKFMEMVKMG